MVVASFCTLPAEIKRKILEHALDLNYGFINNKSFKNLLNLRRTCHEMNEHVLATEVNFRLGVLINVSPRNEAIYYYTGIPTEEKVKISCRLFQFIGEKTNWRCTYLKVKKDIIEAESYDDEVVKGMPEHFETFFENLAKVCEGSVKFFALDDFVLGLRPLIESIFDRLADRCFLDVMNIHIKIEMCLPRYDHLLFIPERQRKNVVSFRLDRHSFSELEEQDFTIMNTTLPSLNTVGLKNVKSLTLLSLLSNLTRLEMKSLPGSILPDDFELRSILTLIIFDQEGDPTFLPRIICNCFPSLRYLHLTPDAWSSALWVGLNFSKLPLCCHTLCVTYSIMDSFRNCGRVKKLRLMRDREERDFFTVEDFSRFNWNLELFVFCLYCNNEENFNLYFSPFMHLFNIQSQLKVFSIDAIGLKDAKFLASFIVEHQTDIYNHPSIRYMKIGSQVLLDRPLDPALNSWISKMQEVVDVYPRWVIRHEKHRPTLIRNL